MKRISINKLLANPELYNEKNFYGFYDWFCSDGALKSRYEKLLKKVKILVELGFVDGDKCYVWFKNNCPVDGSLYDDIRFSDIRTDEFYGGIAPSSGHNSEKGVCRFWTLKDGYECDEFESWSDFKRECKIHKLSLKS
ncbi:hypothetical protein [Vibrio phage phiKT1024]|nr:hypothetical protein [Vibrio phage phiKT1024]